LQHRTARPPRGGVDRNVWLLRAEEARAIAEHMPDEDVKQAMLAIAKSYEDRQKSHGNAVRGRAVNLPVVGQPRPEVEVRKLARVSCSRAGICSIADPCAKRRTLHPRSECGAGEPLRQPPHR
jgi:hypothetical protein